MCRLRNIAMGDYQESVTTGQTHACTHTHRQTDADKVIPMCRYASQATSKIRQRQWCGDMLLACRARGLGFVLGSRNLISEIGYLLLPGPDITEIMLKRRKILNQPHPEDNEPLNAYWQDWKANPNQHMTEKFDNVTII